MGQVRARDSTSRYAQAEQFHNPLPVFIIHAALQIPLGFPSFTPCAFFAASASLVRRLMSTCSNCANTENRVIIVSRDQSKPGANLGEETLC